MSETVTVRAIKSGDSAEKQAAWDAFYATVRDELPTNADGTISGTYWVGVMTAVKAYLKSATV